MQYSIFHVCFLCFDNYIKSYNQVKTQKRSFTFKYLLGLFLWGQPSPNSKSLVTTDLFYTSIIFPFRI